MKLLILVLSCMTSCSLGAELVYLDICYWHCNSDKGCDIDIYKKGKEAINGQIILIRGRAPMITDGWELLGCENKPQKLSHK